MKKLLLIIAVTFSYPYLHLCSAQYTVLHSFNDTAGAGPLGTLTLSGGMFYGMTAGGGANGYGCIFEMDTLGNHYRDIWDFDDTGSVGNANGELPEGSLIPDYALEK